MDDLETGMESTVYENEQHGLRKRFIDEKMGPRYHNWIVETQKRDASSISFKLAEEEWAQPFMQYWEQGPEMLIDYLRSKNQYRVRLAVDDDDQYFLCVEL